MLLNCQDYNNFDKKKVNFTWELECKLGSMYNLVNLCNYSF